MQAKVRIETKNSIRSRTLKSASILTDRCTRIKQNDTKIIKSNFSFIKGLPSPIGERRPSVRTMGEGRDYPSSELSLPLEPEPPEPVEPLPPDAEPPADAGVFTLPVMSRSPRRTFISSPTSVRR